VVAIVTQTVPEPAVRSRQGNRTFTLGTLSAATETRTITYDATQGVRISRDPIDSVAYALDAMRVSYRTNPLSNVELNQGPNLYEYVANHPLGLIDPSGLGPVGPGGAAMGNAANCCRQRGGQYTTWGTSAYGSVDACVSAIMNQNGLPPNLNRCGGALGLIGGLAKGWGAGACTAPFIAVGTGVGSFNLGLWMEAEAICNQMGCWGANGMAK
jgi:hypothetical protein